MAAEFKISRLKYTWKGQWTAGAVYNPDDVVQLSGKVFTCLERHTASINFYNDLNFLNSNIPPQPEPKWELTADGVRFAGSWAPSTFYAVGDIVRFGSISYICVEGHTSVPTQEQFNTDLITNSYWAVFYSGIDWRSNWSVSTFYRVGDLVKFSGKSYVCNQAHTSSGTVSPGLFDDIAKWDEFIDGIKWRGIWTASTIYYINDIVKYGGIVYRCNTQHTSNAVFNLGLEQDQNNWDVEHSGIEYRSDWGVGETYLLNDIVKYGGYLYKCLESHTTSSTFDSSKFEIYVPGNQYESTWNAVEVYQPGDVVRHGGFLFVSNETNVNSQPEYDDTTLNPNWSLLLTGTKIRGDWSVAQAYQVGDLVRRNGQVYYAKRNLAAGSETDIIGDGSTINSDDWELYIPGELWFGLWRDDVTFVIGDIVSFRGASYRCKEKHISEVANRPDVGLGVYWEQYTYGDPNNVLTDIGDLKYYAVSSTANLAIGTPGQALTVQSSLPVWKNFNSSNAVYFVSTEGIDDSSRGTTLNSAWRTIRYALDNIEGPATLLVKSGTYDEILPLRVPANVAVVGDELRGAVVQPANGYFSSLDLTYFDAVFDLFSDHIEKIVTNVSIDKFGVVKQVFSIAINGTITDIANINVYLTSVRNIMNTGIIPSISGSNINTPNNAATLISLNRNFLQSEAVAFLRQTYGNIDLDEFVIKSSVDKVLQAIINDLKYSGNYETVRAGTYFYYGANYNVNKVQNMFLLRDGTGLRNMTLSGLTGTLGPVNQFLTKRPTAGAYASLDPGWGTTHEAVWVGNRSPYVQNVTTFGTACIGLKVDGSLHQGGNKTIVANDFTQILSDGIGVWCNADGGSEVVSVFTYYNHIGYLCTSGGKIRGTNGNCSYGEYGAVAEGFDLTEVPITGTVNNRYYDAIVSEAFTNSNNILKLFYENAGQDYTSVSYSVTGSGINASLIGDEFRDGAVYQIRLADLDGSTQPFGTGYTLSVNNAQAGDQYTITLGASTDQTEAYFQNMRIVIPSGTGAGQYGRVASYNNTSKVLFVSDERRGAWSVTSSSTGTNDFAISTGNSYGANFTNILVGDRIVFTGTVFGGVSNYTVYTVSSVAAGPRIQLEDSLGNPIIPTDATGSMEMHVLGWNHFQPGTVIESVLNTTTLYSIEARIIFSEATALNYTENMGIVGDWSDIAYGNGIFIAVTDGAGSGGTIAARSINGITWSNALLPANETWSAVAYGNDKFVAATSSGTGVAATSVDGLSWTGITMPPLNYTDIIYGDGVWIAVARDGRRLARSTNGTTWSLVVLPEGGDWSSVAYGKGIFVAVAESDSSTTQSVYSTDGGLTWTLGSISGGCKSITYGNNRFVAIEGGYLSANRSYISFDGINWQQGELPSSASWQSVTYGQGQFRAVAGFEAVIAKSDDGLLWTTDSLATGSNYRCIAFGNPNQVPMIIAPISGTSSAGRLKATGKAQGRAVISDNKVQKILIFEPGCGYDDEPTLTIVDPNNLSEANPIVRIANGVLGSPSLANSGEGYTTISTRVSVSGDGFIDQYQTGRELIISNAQRIPSPGDNLRIAGIDDYVYKVISAVALNGTAGNYTVKMVIAKQLGANESPEHGTNVTIRQKYSQVRLTGHDFLDIGLGNFQQTNYPNTLFPNGTVVSPQNEIKEADGGRVFYTSTDQDGNFRCGELFAVEQSTGTVTISADFFELQGLEELSIGGISVGGSGVVIREFSTDQLFTADSNNIIPTQKAIRAYLARRISGGGSDAFTATFTAGIVRVGPQALSTTTLERLEFPNKMYFKSSYAGTLLATQYFVSNNPIDDDLVG